MGQEGMGGQEGAPTAIPSGAAGGDLTGTYPNPTIAALAVTAAKVATANKDGTAGTASMRTLGTSAVQACAGNDSRLSDSRAPSGAATGDLTGTYPAPTVAALAITDAKVAVANKDGAAGTASMRTLGTGAAQACAGNDSRLSDSRAPSGSASGDLTGTYPGPTIAALAVTDAKVATANKDGTAGTASMRTLGTAATQACAGNDSRLSDSRAPSGAATGDLTGTYPAPTLAAVVTGATVGASSKLVRSVTYDAKGRMSGAATEVDLGALATGLLKNTTSTGALSTATPGVDYATGDAREYWTAQAAAKLNLSPKNLFRRWIDFDDGSPLRVISSGSTPALTPPASDGSWHQYSAGDDTSAGAFGFAAANVFSSTPPKQIANIKTSPWYLVARWKTTTTPGATARSVIGAGINGEIRAGIVKASHATKFCAVWTGAVLASTISFDTATHEVALRNDGTNVYLSVDGEAEVSAAVGSLSTVSAELFFEIAAGAGEARQTFQIDYMGLWTGRAA